VAQLGYAAPGERAGAQKQTSVPQIKAATQNQGKSGTKHTGPASETLRNA